MHLAFCKFKQPFMNLCAHFGHTRPHRFAADGDAMGDPSLPDALAGMGVLVRPQVVPRPVVVETPQGTLWVILWMVMMPPALMRHHVMYPI